MQSDHGKLLRQYQGYRQTAQIQKGTNPEKAARNGYEKTFECLVILNYRILIQQQALAYHCKACKALAHMLQRQMYIMGIPVLIRREAEMTHLQPHVGDTTHQELQSSPFYCATIAYHVRLITVLGWPRASRPTSKKNRHL